MIGNRQTSEDTTPSSRATRRVHRERGERGALFRRRDVHASAEPGSGCRSALTAGPALPKLTFKWPYGGQNAPFDLGVLLKCGHYDSKVLSSRSRRTTRPRVISATTINGTALRIGGTQLHC